MQVARPSDSCRAADAVRIYIRLTGALWIVIAGIWFWLRWRQDTDSPSIMLLWVALGIVVPLIAFGLARKIESNRALDLILLGSVLSLVGYLIFRGERGYAIVIAAAQTVTFLSLRQARYRTLAGAFGIVLSSLFAWTLASGLTFTQLDSLFAGVGQISPYFPVAFAVVFAIVLLETAAPQKRTRSGVAGTCLAIVAIFAFAELALRSDGITGDWVPYHQTFWTGPAELVRQGHWLLWDVPTQYGFLSILSVASLPFSSAWESLHVLSAIFSFACALMLFVLLRLAQRTPWGYAVAIALPIAALLGPLGARWPFGLWLYPQIGMRFQWEMTLLFIVGLLTVYGARFARLLHFAGWAVWSISVLWSFETAFLSTLVWGGYLGTRSALEAMRSERPLASATAAIARLATTFAGLCLAMIIGVTTFYLARLGHAPDFRSYLEFTALYASQSEIPISVEVLKNCWILVLAMLAVTMIVIAAFRPIRKAALPPLVSSWLAVWGASAYYAGEPYSKHVASIIGVIIVAWAVVSVTCKFKMRPSPLIDFGRCALAPVTIVLVASTFGSAEAWAHLRVPLERGYHIDVARDLPPIGGTLAAALVNAGIRPDDYVALPTYPLWSKLDNGLISPVMRGPQGELGELRTWLPTSPVGEDNTFEALPPDRREVYLARFAELLTRSGWLVTYGQPARCEDVFEKPVLATIRSSANGPYSVALCRLARR